MVSEVASKTTDQAGDGTTTATVLAHAIVMRLSTPVKVSERKTRRQRPMIR
jgi:chaperonin GroEL (HSP60 family)